MTQSSGAILVAQAAATEDAGGADAGGGGGAGGAEGGAAGEPGGEPAADLSALWDMDGADYECDCPGPPPEFRLPPPPRPPFLQESDCSEGPLLDLETCDAVPVIDAEFHSSPAIPSLAVIVVCSVLLAAMVLIASVLVWKHKRKMQNFLPCKTSPQNRCDVSNGNGVIYEDLTNIRPRTLPNHCATGQTAPSIEMIDVKGPASAGYGGAGNIFVCQAAPRAEPYASQDLYNPVYEELSNGSGERPDSEPESEALAGGSEDEFADEELSLGGDADAAGAGSGGSGGGAGSNSASGSASASAADANSLSGASAASDDAHPRAHPPPPTARRAAPHAHAHAHPHALAHSLSHAPHAPHALPPLAQHHAPLQPLPADGDAERRASARHRFAQHVQSADSLATVGVDERGRYTLASPGAGVRGGAYGAPPPGYRTERSGRQGAAAAERRPRSLDRRRAWRTKAPATQAPPPPLPPAAAVAAAAAAAAQGHEFHEGLLLDALLQLYPSVGGGGGGGAGGGGGGGGGRAGRNAPPSGHAHAPVPSVAHRLPYLMPPLAAAAAAPALPAPPRTHLVNPYESVPVLNHLHQHHHHHGGSGGGPAGHAHPHAYAPPQRPDMFSTFRPAPPSQDSSFGSDSGYSNHTSGGGGGGGGGGTGGGGGRSGSRGRKENHRLSAHSGDLVIS